MTPAGHLLACIEQHGPDGFVGAYVGEDAGPDPRSNFPGRAPATHRFVSREAARQWIQTEANALSLPVKWVDRIAWPQLQNHASRQVPVEVC